MWQQRLFKKKHGVRYHETQKSYGDSQLEVNIGVMIRDLSPGVTSLKKEVEKLQTHHAAELAAESDEGDAFPPFYV